MQSTRTNPYRIERQIRVDARWKIIQEVNKHLMRQRKPRFQVVHDVHGSFVASALPPAKLIGMKDIQRAVWIARRFRLVDNLTLQRAGYRGY